MNNNDDDDDNQLVLTTTITMIKMERLNDDNAVDDGDENQSQRHCIESLKTLYKFPVVVIIN